MLSSDAMRSWLSGLRKESASGIVLLAGDSREHTTKDVPSLQNVFAWAVARFVAQSISLRLERTDL